MLKRWLGNLGGLLALLLIAGLALLIIVVGAQFLYLFAQNPMGATRWSITLIMDTYYILLGMLWLGLFLLMDHLLLGEAARAGLMLPRALYAAGIEILILGLLHAALLAYRPLEPFSVGLALVELACGSLLIWISRRKAPRADAF